MPIGHRLERAAVLDHLPQRIVTGWEKLEDRVRETGAHRYFLPEHKDLCERMDLLYPKDDVAHRFANGELDLRKRMTRQAERLDIAAKELGECVEERQSAEAGDLPFVRQEGYASWRLRAERVVRQAGEILSERTEYAPHLDRDLERGKTLKTLSRALDRTLREESAEWDRIRNERAGKERHQDLDRSQDQGFSWLHPSCRQGMCATGRAWVTARAGSRKCRSAGRRWQTGSGYTKSIASV